MTTTYTGYGTRSTTTPQTEPIPGKNMVPNSGGGYSFAVDDMTRLRRFLVLGAAGGTYYVGERKLVKENLDALERLLQAGRGKEVIDLIVEISTGGNAPNNDPALFALARCVACDVHGKVSYLRPQQSNTLHRIHHEDLFEHFPEEGVEQPLWKGTAVRHGETITYTRAAATSPTLVDHPEDIAVRQYAERVVHRVARTGTHWLHFQAFVEQFRGRGPVLKRLSQNWYNQKNPERLAYQVAKYQSRDGWSQRDVLRLARPKPETTAHSALYQWVTKGWNENSETIPVEDSLGLIWAFERAKKTSEPNEVADLILKYKLTREMVLTESLKSKKVWEALLEEMPLEALTRNLATMTRNGVLVPMGEMTKKVLIRLGDAEAIKKARLHPIKLLSALLTYQSGKSVRGDATWTPLREIVDALNAAFYLAFKSVEPSNKRIVLALDVSGSMASGMVAGVPGLTPRVASAALALVTAATEPNYAIMAFSTNFMPLTISPKQRLDDVVRITSGLNFGGTDCALPMLWALQNNIQADAFVIYTDNETWAGRVHPVQALQQYRKRFNIPAKLVVVGMTATQFSIADSNDAGMLDVVGMDTATPELIASFIRGDI